LRFLIFTLLLVTGCTTSQENKPSIDMTFVLLEEGTGVIKVINSKLAKKRFSPCSTFKVPHAVFGLEKGYLTGSDFTLKYDFNKNPKQSFWPKEWARDHTLKSAIQNSVVWYFQSVARNIGSESMTEYLSRAQFGNQNISAGIDTFWLGSSLKISPIEQVNFWSKLFKNDLPFKKENVSLVKDIIIEKKTEDYVLRAKTGACSQSNKKKSTWWVGSVEQNNKTYYFATFLMDDNFKRILKERKSITRDLLKKEGLL